MLDCVILGGGIIGLSVAEELATSGLEVQVLDHRPDGRTASWAAAGILPPPIARAVHDPMEQLRALGHRLYVPWCQRLSESGQQVEAIRTGGIYVARSPGERVALQASLAQWQADGVRVERWSRQQLRDAEPHVVLPTDAPVYLLPDEHQVRPPRLLKALGERLRDLGVSVFRCTDPVRWVDISVAPVAASSGERFAAKHYCVTGGPWTPSLLSPLGLELPIEPRRGQMVMWKLPRPVVTRTINEGPRYLVPREDGHLLAGSTVEDVGFDANTTQAGVDTLVRFARGLIPSLPTVADASWAGLRPMPNDGLPYLGTVPGHPHVHVATGHFRSGIHLAPATARLIRQAICGEVTDLDLSPYSLSR